MGKPGIIFRSAARLLSDNVNATVGAALLRCKMRTGMSDAAIAERLGKENRKSAASYIAGTTSLDLLGFLNAIQDDELGDEFGNDVLRLVHRRLCPITAERAPVDQVATEVAGFLTSLLRAWSDKKIDHREKLALAKLLRPLMPKLQAIIADADAVLA